MNSKATPEDVSNSLAALRQALKEMPGMAASLTPVLAKIENLTATVAAQEDRFTILAETFDVLRSGIAVIDSQGTLLLCNTMLKESLSLPDEISIPGVPLARIIAFAKENREWLDADAESAFLQIANGQVYRQELVRTDGSHIRIRRDDIKNGAFVLTFSNVSVGKAKQKALAKALEDAEAANRVKSQFMSTISHELRTPMNAVIGMTDLLLGTELSDTQREFAATIRESGRALLTEINEILSVSDLESGHVRLNISDFDPRVIINEVVENLRPRADVKSLPIHCQISPDVPEQLRGDGKSLQTILANLLGNAIKFTEKGHVELQVEAEKTERGEIWVRFSIIDTGIGIQKEQADALFSAFRQGDSSTSRRYGGLGIGLTLAKMMAEFLKGSIGFSSVYGKGSTFSVLLPFAMNKPPAGLEKKKSLNILVADDNDINRRVIGGLLDSASYKCSFVNNGKQALEAVESGTFALVLMDIEMPVMDGLEATQAIRALPGPMNAIPVIAVTGHAYPEDIKKIQAAGLNDHLAKPIQRAALIDIIAKWGGGNSAGSQTGAEQNGGAVAPPDGIGSRIDQRTINELNQALGHGVLRDLMRAYMEDAKIRYDQIGIALANNDHALLEKECHSLQGASGNMGVRGVSEFAQSLVALCRNGKGEEAAALAPRLLGYINDSFSALNKMGYG